MQQQIQQAIADRRSVGKSDEEIISEFIAAGYPEDQARELVQSPQDTVASIPPATETISAEPTDQYGSLSTPDKSGSKRYLILAAVGGLIAVVVIVLILLRYENVIRLSTFLTGSPYPDEGAFTGGLVVSAGTMRYIDMDTQISAEFVPIDESLPIKRSDEIDEAFALLESLGIGVLSEGHAKLGAGGVFDYRDEENIEFSIDLTADVLFEPIFFRAAGSVRQVDERSFVRLTDVPTLLESSVEWMPIGQWVETDGAAGLSPTDVLPTNPALLIQAGAASGFFSRSGIDVSQPLRLAMTAQRNPGLLSQVSPANVIATMPEQSEFTDEQIDVMVDALTERPPFVFVGEPERMSDEDGVVFEYHTDLHYENLVYLLALTAEGEVSTTVVTSDELAEIEQAIPRESVELFNELVDMSFFVRSNGDFTGYKIESYLHPADAKSVVHLLLETHWQPLDADTSLGVPESIHERTLEELADQSAQSGFAPDLFGMNEARDSSRDASIMQTLNNLRLQAEIAYNRNGKFSYQNVCADSGIELLLETARETAEADFVVKDGQSSTLHVTCNDSDVAYAVSAPLVSEVGTLWCVDSTGFAGKVSTLALVSGDDFRCSTGSTGSEDPTTVESWPSPRAQDPGTGILEIRPTDHVRGNPDAEVVIIEYCGYQDPFCQRFHDSMLLVMDDWEETGQVAWVYRHYPLDMLHPDATNAAIAGECVAETSGNQAFWDFTDTVFILDKSDGSIEMDLIHQLASAFTENDFQSYMSCYEQQRTLGTVTDMMTQGERDGLRGTPHSIAFLANDPTKSAVIQGAVAYEQVSQYIRGLLAE